MSLLDWAVAGLPNRRRKALSQPGEGHEKERLSLVRAVADQEDNVKAPFRAVRLELFRVMGPNPP
jgi:hypothetical protein